MARLLGFQKTAAGDSAKVISLIEKSYLNQTTGGEFNTSEDVQGLIDIFSKLPQSTEVQLKVADLTNKKLQIEGKLNDILSQKNVFEMDLQKGLDNAAKNSLKNMRSLIGAYASIYGDAADRYDNEVLSDIAKRYGTTGTIPDETLKYRDTLNEKAKFYAELFNSYNTVDEKTGELGALDTSGIAVQIDTNPKNGSVNRIEIVPSGQVDPKTYMRTDVGLNVMDDLPNKKLPVYLRTNDVGVTADGKAIRGSNLGGITYEEQISQTDGGGSRSAGFLTPKKESVGFFSKINFFSDTQEELKNNSINSIKANGLRFSSSAYNYDSQDIPNDNILKMGNRLFYSTSKDNQILEIAGKDSGEKIDNLNKYLTSIGKDPNKMSPYFITRDYLTAPDGSSRVQGNVDANYFSPQSSPSQPTSFDTSSSPPTIPTDEGTPPATSFFGDALRVNRQNKPDTPSLESGSGMFSSNLIEQGKSFFRNRI